MAEKEEIEEIRKAEKEEEKEIVSLRDRVAFLEKYARMGGERIGGYYRENPKKAMCMTLLAGLAIGFLLGTTSRKKED